MANPSLIRQVQKSVEDALFATQPEVETAATALALAGDKEGAAALLSEYSNTAADTTIAAWSDLFEFLMTKYVTLCYVV